MDKQHYVKIVKTYYDALDEGKILGRKCPECGHVEFPPYLACNECGALDTEWVEISGKGVVTELVPCPMIFTDPFFGQATEGKYVLGTVKPENSDEYSVPIVNITAEHAAEVADKLPLPVRPVIFQDNGYKFVAWELDE